MIIDLRLFDDFPAHAVVLASPGEFQPFDELVLEVNNVVLTASLQKTETEYFCQGTVEADVRIQCSRCAKDFAARWDQAIDFVIRSQDDVPAEERDILDDEDYVYLQGKSDVADVTDIVHQALVLALPLKPLCSEDCKGLCPVCRENLNDRACTCKTDHTDPRWDDLRDLLQN